MIHPRRASDLQIRNGGAGCTAPARCGSYKRAADALLRKAISSLLQVGGNWIIGDRKRGTLLV
jgi:hypothetical protein